jgi:flagellar basal body-associated protein FliL
MKKTEIIIVAASILAAVVGGSYFLMGSKKSSNDVDSNYNKGSRIVMSNINPVPSELKENYFGGKRSKKRKTIRKNKTTKR